jgi:hypothetical protein
VGVPGGACKGVEAPEERADDEDDGDMVDDDDDRPCWAEEVGVMGATAVRRGPITDGVRAPLWTFEWEAEAEAEVEVARLGTDERFMAAEISSSDEASTCKAAAVLGISVEGVVGVEASDAPIASIPPKAETEDRAWASAVARVGSTASTSARLVEASTVMNCDSIPSTLVSGAA